MCSKAICKLCCSRHSVQKQILHWVSDTGSDRKIQKGGVHRIIGAEDHPPSFWIFLFVPASLTRWRICSCAHQELPLDSAWFPSVYAPAVMSSAPSWHNPSVSMGLEFTLWLPTVCFETDCCPSQSKSSSTDLSFPKRGRDCHSDSGFVAIMIEDATCLFAVTWVIKQRKGCTEYWKTLLRSTDLVRIISWNACTHFSLG